MKTRLELKGYVRPDLILCLTKGMWIPIGNVESDVKVFENIMIGDCRLHDRPCEFEGVVIHTRCHIVVKKDESNNNNEFFEEEGFISSDAIASIGAPNNRFWYEMSFPGASYFFYKFNLYPKPKTVLYHCIITT